MKKFLSLLLSSLMLLTCITPAFAETTSWFKSECDDPVIYITGDSQKLYYDNDSKVFCIDDIGNLLTADTENGQTKTDKVLETTAAILKPFILEGILLGKWDNYYAAVEKEITEMFEPVRLDYNGNVPEGSDCGLSQEQQNRNAWKQSTYITNANGKFDEGTYKFEYDWRLDPIENAEILNTFIENVKRVTGRKRVSIESKCLGTNVVLAYINKYGTESIKGLGIGVATSNGADFLSGALSGSFKINGAGLVKLAKELKYSGNTDVHPLITATVQMLQSTGVLDTLDDVTRAAVYEKIEYGIIQALATSTLMTYPCYWALVTVDDFDNALDYCFGKEGSEKRRQYAGLIEKITYYNETIKKHTYDIMAKVKQPREDGTTPNIILVSKYGTTIVPCIKDESILADNYVSVTNSSFGATTSTIYNTLSDEYIAAREAEGNGKYISADKKIDASTCLYPDYTVFIKNCYHGDYWTQERQLIMGVMDAETQFTVDNFGYSQFIVADYADKTWEKMTAENCEKGNLWDADESYDHPSTFIEKIKAFFKSIFAWYKVLFQTVIEKLKTK